MCFLCSSALGDPKERRGQIPGHIHSRKTRHVEIFTTLGRSSQTSLCQGLSFSVGIARGGVLDVDGVRASLPPESPSRSLLVLLQVVRKKERDI